jgi:hypothetical protein
MADETTTTTTTTAAAPTYAELLSAAKRCLLVILTGNQSYTLDGRTYTRADIDKVKKLISELTELAAMEAGTYPIVQNFDLSSAGGYG